MIRSLKDLAICFALSIALLVSMVPMTQSAFADDSATDPGSTGTETTDEGATGTNGSVLMPESRELLLTQDEMTTIDFGEKMDRDNFYYFKVTPAKTGYISLTGKNVRGYVDLLDADRKVASKEDKKESSYFSASSSFPYQKVVSFGVKKGKTYYIRIKFYSWKWDSGAGYYHGSLKWTNTGVSNIKCGASRSSAVALRKELKKSGVIKAGSRKAQWFKIKTTKKKVKITFSAKENCGTMYALVYYKTNGKWKTARMTVLRSAKRYKTACTLKKRSRKKITYYVKVYPKYKASGAFGLKWE